MKVGIIGCGYVFDHYMATWRRHKNLEIAGITDLDRDRVRAVTAFYNLKAYSDTAAILADPEIELILNLTSVESHYGVTKAALKAGKHVYSEKPLVTSMNEAKELIALAEEQGLRLQCAPSNALSATAQTMRKLVDDGILGDVRMVYAEFDDNPIYLMNPEGWRSRSGAPWPYLHEYETGCTLEHVGYHLTWMCAIFGPVKTVTAFSKHTLPDKTDEPVNSAATPDFSVACLDFECGVVGRVTCSIAAPYDHRMRIIGNRGMVHADTYRHYECPVYFERFTKLSMNARKARSVRTNTFLQWPFGIGGRRLPLTKSPPPGSNEIVSFDGPWWEPKALLQRFKRRQVGQQDKAIGLAELADALRTGRTPFPSHEFTLHLTELTLAIQAAGTESTTHRMKTRFDKAAFPELGHKKAPDYHHYVKSSLLNRLTAKMIDRMHAH